MPLAAALTGAEPLVATLGSAGAAARHLQQLAATIGLERALGGWLDRANPPILGQLIAGDKLAPSQLFTHFGDFLSRRVSAPQKAAMERRKPAP